ncbi:MAG: MmgE/PrpD family protein [Methanobacteriaceae archaeon]|jgi:2-methylcitrate dehydratase PrpD|nr:MmgE/PrpD family protein [Candidatus Methanorudis spinitermitis]
MIAEKLSEFAINLKYENIPKIAIEKAKLCFIDFLGVTNRGFHEESSKIAIKALDQLKFFSDRDNQMCSIIGGTYSNVLGAGFINGISAHGIELDDGHRFAQLHPGSIVFSSALAICEAENLKGQEFFEAIICGYEIAIILGKLANPYHRNQGFHSTGTITTFASGITVAKLLKLDLDQTIAAIGLCGTQSSGLLESDHKGTMGKQLHAGKAVFNGILSAYLAKNGFTGVKSIIEGHEGFLKAMATVSFDEIFNRLINDENYLKDFLDNEVGKYHINDVYFKMYPFCRHLHSSIDSTLSAKRKMINDINNNNPNNSNNSNSNNNFYDFEEENIEKIIIETYKIASKHNNFHPKNKEDLKQSLPYAIAIATLHDDATLKIIENIDFNSYEFKNILNKIVIKENNKFNDLTPNYRPSKTIIKTTKGTFKDFIKLPKGEVENPFKREDILKKFGSLNPNFDLNKLKLINNLESSNIRDFMKIFNYQ